MKRSMRSGPPFGLAVLGLAAALFVFAPRSAFAQRGGGHASGGHAGSGGHGGFGGSHSSGSSHSNSHASAPARSSAPSHVAPPSGATPPAAGAGTPAQSGAAIVTPPSGTPTAPVRPAGAPPAEQGIALAPAAPPHTTIGFPPASGAVTFPAAPARTAPLSFSGQGHEIWQTSQPRTATAPRGSSTITTPPGGLTRPQPPHIVRNQPPFIQQPFVFFPSYGFFGWSPFLGLGFGGCDPFYPWTFACSGGGYGYYNYPANGPGWDSAPPPPPDQPSSEYGPFSVQPQPGNSAESGSEANQPSEPAAPPTLLYLSDGSSYEVTDYWLAGDKLHYITNYGGENSVPVARLDLQRTVEANVDRGVTFTLRAAPPALTPPPSADSAPPAPQEPNAPPSPNAPEAAAPPAPRSPDAPPAPSSPR